MYNKRKSGDRPWWRKKLYGALKFCGEPLEDILIPLRKEACSITTTST